MRTGAKIHCCFLNCPRMERFIQQVSLVDFLAFHLLGLGGLFNVLPGCYPIVLVNDFVYKKLAEGADLMLPGVYVSETFSLPKFPSNSPVLVAMLNDNTITGPLAVATSLMSSDEMISNGMKGRGFRILHIYNDELWLVCFYK